MIQHHLVLDTPTLLAPSDNRQVSALIHRAYTDAEMRLRASRSVLPPRFVRRVTCPSGG